MDCVGTSSEIQMCTTTDEPYSITIEDSVLTAGDVENEKISHTETAKGDYCEGSDESTTLIEPTENREHISDDMTHAGVSSQVTADPSANSLERHEELINNIITSNRAVKDMIVGLKSTTAKIRQLLEDVMVSSNDVGPMLEQIHDMNQSARDTARSLLEVYYMHDRLVERFIRREKLIDGTSSSAEVATDEE